MKFAVVLLLAALGAAVATTKSYEGYKVYKFTATNSRQLAALTALGGATGYDYWSRHQILGAPLTLMVAPPQQPSFLKFLAAQDVTYEVIIEDAQTVFEAESMGQVEGKSGRISFTQYERHDTINAYLDQLAAQFPSKCTVETIGTSFENRVMKILKISKNPAANNPIIFIDGGIHAREWISPAMVLYVIQEIVEKTTNDNLLDGLDWHIIPVMNPDGYEYTHTDDRMWRKTRSTTVSTTCPGVDPNRNFGFHWGEGGTSTVPCSDIYQGPTPFSEKETEALRAYLDIYKTRIPLYVTVHSYGETFLYPWSYTVVPPTNQQELETLAHRANDAQVAAGGNSFEIGESTVLYGKTAGSSDDWAMGGALIRMAYTIEMPGGGSTGFNPPPTAIVGIVTPIFQAFREFGLAIQGNKQ